MVNANIRFVDSADAASVAAIYAHHVASGTATFDMIARTVEETRLKIGDCAERQFPFLVYAEGNAVLGYAYATQFRDRPAYRLTCEDSIYVHPDHVGQGIGKQLLRALIYAAEAAGYRQMIAVVGGGEPGSVAVHASLGFEHAGQMRSVGRKFGQWLDTVYMQRSLGSGDTVPPEREP